MRLPEDVGLAGGSPAEAMLQEKKMRISELERAVWAGKQSWKKKTALIDACGVDSEECR
jgi:hypothetical protein